MFPQVIYNHAFARLFSKKIPSEQRPNGEDPDC